MATHVRSDGVASGSTVPSLAVTFGTTTTSGNLIVVFVSVWHATAPPAVTISDNKGNSYGAAIADRTMTAGAGYRLLAFYCPNIVGGASHQVTATPSPAGSHWLTVSVHEYSGIATASPLDVDLDGEDGSTAAPDAGPITTTAAGLVIATLVRPAGWSTLTPGSGYVSRYEQNLGARNPLAVIDKAAATAGSQTATWTFDSTADPNVWEIAGFKDVTAGSLLPLLLGHDLAGGMQTLGM